MKKQILTSLLLIIGYGVIGCAATPPAPTSPAASTASSTKANAAPPAAPAQGRTLQESDIQKLAHFAFDSSMIEGENKGIIEQNARYMSANPQLKVHLAGHCDERGTREYNLALGERRAHAVERMMQASGVTANRISTVSFGEEKPLADGHAESAWQQNRRVEFIYK